MRGRAALAHGRAAASPSQLITNFVKRLYTDKIIITFIFLILLAIVVIIILAVVDPGATGIKVCMRVCVCEPGGGQAGVRITMARPSQVPDVINPAGAASAAGIPTHAPTPPRTRR